jgi:hypothetical protein
MKECAFCPNTAGLSLEHVVSDWMNELFVGPVKARMADSAGFLREWSSAQLDWTVKVVCEPCNNGWMSDIEGKHAKPVMTPLIKGETLVPVGSSEAHSLALFAFKTAVILDHANRRDKAPFFSSRMRYGFRRHLAIPGTVQMWLCGYDGHRNSMRVQVVYHEGELGPAYPIQMYVLTFGIGCLVFQVLSAKHFGSIGLAPPPGFERLAVPFWPEVIPGFVWPNPLQNISKVSEFDRFSFRWGEVIPVSPILR